MSLQFCLGCTAAYSVGASACPQCGSTEYTDTPPSDQASPAEPTTGAEAPAAPKRRSKPTPPPDEPAEAPAP